VIRSNCLHILIGAVMPIYIEVAKEIAPQHERALVTPPVEEHLHLKPTLVQLRLVSRKCSQILRWPNIASQSIDFFVTESPKVPSGNMSNAQ